jgi:hypothetical protein
MNVAMILAKRFADKKWSISGEDYDNIDWKDSSPKPTNKDLEKLWEEVRVEAHNEEQSLLRRKAYQEESDPLFFEYQRDSVTKEDWLNKVESIKEKYPYISHS